MCLPVCRFVWRWRYVDESKRAGVWCLFLGGGVVAAAFRPGIEKDKDGQGFRAGGNIHAVRLVINSVRGRCGSLVALHGPFFLSFMGAHLMKGIYCVVLT